MQTPPGGSGARVNGSAFDRPCEGAVVCAWGGDPAFLHGESVCRHHLEGRVRGSMGARLADLAKAWLFALGAETPRFGMVSPGQTPPGGSGARVNGSAFGKPCEGAVVCAWGGDPTFTETAVMGHTGIFASETTLMAPPPASSLSETTVMGPIGAFVVPSCTYGPL